MDVSGVVSCSVQSDQYRWTGAHSIPSKRRRSMNGETGHTGDTASSPSNQPIRNHSGFLLIDGQKGVYYSESWTPNGSTLYLPVNGSVLANMNKYDQISFEQGCFCIGDETGRFQQKAQGQAINCWRFSEHDRKLFVALSYFFTNVQVFQEVLNSLQCL